MSKYFFTSESVTEGTTILYNQFIMKQSFFIRNYEFPQRRLSLWEL